jgi:hypothetical protein
MRAWTIQRLERYETLLRDGVIVTTWRDLLKTWDAHDRKSFGRAYSWLVAQYNKRVGRLRRPPIWLDIQPPSAADMRRTAPFVLLEVELPDGVALALDSTNWYWVLWNSPFCDSPYVEYPDDNSAYEAENARLKADRHALRASWEKVFDLDLGRRGDMYIGAECIVPDLRAEWIVSTTFLPVLADAEWYALKDEDVKNVTESTPLG